MIGAGTVIDPADVARVKDGGGRLIVMPHGDAAVIRAAKASGMWCLPGVSTPTEAFAAIDAGANVFVAGTATFKGGPSAYADNIAALKAA